MARQTALAVRAHDGELRVESRFGPLAHVGVIPHDLSQAKDNEISRGMGDALTTIGIAPLFFKDIGLTAPKDVNDSITRLDKTRWYCIRLGATNIHDDAWRNWTRRPLAEYVLDGNPIPPAAVTVLERLQAARLPIGCSIMVWVPNFEHAPAAGTPGSHARPRALERLLLRALPMERVINLRVSCPKSDLGQLGTEVRR